MKTNQRLAILATNLRRIFRDPTLFLVYVIAPIAFIMLVIVPPFQAPDEHTHFFKAVQLSEGKLIGHRMGYSSTYPFPLAGDYLPGKYWLTSQHYLITSVTQKVPHSVVVNDLEHPITTMRPIATPFENTVVYPPLAYIPQAVTIFVVNLFVKSPLIQMYAARLAVLAASITLLYWAVKRMPFGKWVVVALTATPMSLLLLVSCSGDAVTIALSAFFIANVLAATMKRTVITRTEVVTLLVMAAALGMTKSPYQLVIFTILIVPFRRFAAKKRYMQMLAAVIGIPLILATLWAVVVNRLYLNVAQGSNTPLQVHYLMVHPLSFMHAMLRTYYGNAGDYVPRDLIDLSAGLAAPSPLWFIVASYMFIVLLLLQERLASIWTVVLMKRTRIISLLLGVLVFMGVNASLYATFTTVGAPFINGLQGRYFIPVAYLLVPGLIGLLPTTKERYQKLLTVFRCFVGFTAAMAYLAVVRRYY